MLKTLLLCALLLLTVKGASLANLQNNGIEFDDFAQMAVDKIIRGIRVISSLLQSSPVASLLHPSQQAELSNMKNTKTTDKLSDYP